MTQAKRWRTGLVRGNIAIWTRYNDEISMVLLMALPLNWVDLVCSRFFCTLFALDSLGTPVNHPIFRRMRVNIHGLIDTAKCYQMVRQLRWSEGIACPQCHGTHIVKNGRDETHDDRQRYLCRGCNLSFDDLTGTVFSGSHHPLSVWMVCLYFMGLNLSNRQIAEELEMNENTIQEMTTILRKGIVAQEPTMMLEGTVECDEVYVIAGHKGHPESVKKRAICPET